MTSSVSTAGSSTPVINFGRLKPDNSQVRVQISSLRESEEPFDVGNKAVGWGNGSGNAALDRVRKYKEEITG